LLTRRAATSFGLAFVAAPTLAAGPIVPRVGRTPARADRGAVGPAVDGGAGGWV